MKPAILYGIGAILISAGVGLVLESGRRSGLAEASKITWEEAPVDADNSGMGIVGDAGIKHHRHDPADESA